MDAMTDNDATDDIYATARLSESQWAQIGTMIAQAEGAPEPWATELEALRVQLVLAWTQVNTYRPARTM